MATKQIGEARDQGDRWAEGMMTVLLASSQHWQGSITESVTSLESARQIFVDISDSWGQLRAIMPLARGLQAIGQRDEADLLVHDAERIVAHYPEGSNERLMPAYLGTELAIQRGDGEMALQIMASAEERARRTFDAATPGGGENLVNRALALAMVGRAEEGVPILHSAAAQVLDVGPAGNILSAYALVLAATGDSAGARTQAERVRALDGGSYLDHTIADLALACADATEGDAVAARAALASVDDRLSPTDDDLAKAIAQLARARVLEALGADDAAEVLAVARDALAELSAEGTGWDAIFRAATA